MVLALTTKWMDSRLPLAGRAHRQRSRVLARVQALLLVPALA